MRGLGLAALTLLASCAPTEDSDGARLRGAPSPPPAITAVDLARQLAVPPESLRAAGEELYARQAYDSAQLVFQVEAARVQQVGDGAAEARARMWSGLAAWRLGDYDAARTEGETSVALKRAHGLDAELSRSYNALGLLAWNEGRLADARGWFDSAIAAARRHDDGAGVARASANLPLVLTQLGDYDGARRGFEAAIADGKALDDPRLEGNALTNLAMLDTRLGDPGSALEHLAEARERYARIGYATGDVNALGQAATAWAALGDLQRAIAAAHESLELARRQELLQEVAATLEVLADLHHQAGDPRRALGILVEADSLDRALGLVVERGNNLRRQGIILLEVGELDVGLGRARTALAVHAAADDQPEQVLDRLLLAELLARSGDGEGAAAQLDSGRVAARGLGDAARRLVGLTMARLALDAGDPRAALRALNTVPEQRGRADWQALDLRAAALLARGDLAAARAASEAAVAELERERGTLDLGPLRAGYLGGRLAPISRLVEIHLRAGDTAAAFGVAASVPGRGLAEHLIAATDTGLGALAAVRDGERRLRRLAALQAQLDSLGTGDDVAEARAAFEREVAGARRDYERQAAATGRIPRAELLGLTRPSVESLAAAVPDDALLLVTLVGPDRTDLFAVRRGRLSHRSVTLRATELAERVRVARAALLGRPGSEVPEPLRELGRALLGPWESGGFLEGVRRVLVVPHGPLGGLPFAALWLQDVQRYLVEQAAVVVLPSVGTLTRAATEGDAVANLRLFAPLADSLPGTEREVRGIARMVRAEEVRVGRAADEATVRSALATGGMVHIASHGTLDAGNPMFSMMRLSRPRSSAAGDAAADGRLEAHELMRLDVRSPLVFLSGCETGLGAASESVLGGAEEGSLAQAFLYAGAQSVVATLWRVDDREAADLAIRFYGHLAESGPAEALALAQRDGVRENQTFTWAAYTVAGVPGAKIRPRVR